MTALPLRAEPRRASPCPPETALSRPRLVPPVLACQRQAPPRPPVRAKSCLVDPCHVQSDSRRECFVEIVAGEIEQLIDLGQYLLDLGRQPERASDRQTSPQRPLHAA